jgi:hypothetical protein
MKFTYEEIIREYDMGDVTSSNIMKKIKEYIRYETYHGLQHSLVKHYGNEPYRVSSVSFDREMNADGDVQQARIRIHRQWLDVIQNVLIDEVELAYYDNSYFFTEADELDRDALRDAFLYYDETVKMGRAIDKIVDIFVHELVHIGQYRRQGRRLVNVGDIEYRSYLTKDRKEFIRAINSKANEYDMKIYHGSPQEIDAFAHNMAIEMINLAIGGYEVEEFVDRGHIKYLEGMLFSIKEFVKEREFRYAETYKNRYKDFNDPKKRDYYKVYKRFMKKVYQEVDRYMDYIRVKIGELSKKEDWWD